MEGVRTCLENSTIYALAYIAMSKIYVRLLWIIVVIAGFTCARDKAKISFLALQFHYFKYLNLTLKVIYIRQEQGGKTMKTRSK